MSEDKALDPETSAHMDFVSYPVDAELEDGVSRVEWHELLAFYKHINEWVVERWRGGFRSRPWLGNSMVRQHGGTDYSQEPL